MMGDQLYTGEGFPVAVQFKATSAPSVMSKTSGSGLMSVGATREEKNHRYDCLI